MLHEDADDYSVSRFLEAYLLWLFGVMMFSNTYGDSVDKVLMVYAREIANAPEDEVPTWSWGSAVLAATYRGLCEEQAGRHPRRIPAVAAAMGIREVRSRPARRRSQSVSARPLRAVRR